MSHRYFALVDTYIISSDAQICIPARIFSAVDVGSLKYVSRWI